MTSSTPRLTISNRISIPLSEIDCQAIRAQGAGGQNVNKVSSAIHLRFDIVKSSLPQECKAQLRELKDRRITSDGVIVLKAQRFRTQEKNREDAFARLQALIASALQKQKPRTPTKPTRNSQKRRMDSKTKHSRLKNLRGKVDV
tara:strand:+ start:46434 stop:46865 length:432 start_codon:yes stop_codon:yes gene_type:complete